MEDIRTPELISKPYNHNSSPNRNQLGELALEAGRMGAWEWDIRAGTVFWTEYQEQLFGLEPGTFRGTMQDYLKLIHPDDLGKVTGGIEDVLRTKNTLERRFRCIWPNGSIRWIASRGHVQHENETPIGMCGVCWDITDEVDVQAASARLSAIVESCEDAIISKDLNGIIQSWNLGAQKIFGYKPEEIIGRSILTLLPTHLIEEEATIISYLRRGEKVSHFETERQTKDGRIIPVSVTVSPIRDSQGNVIGASKVLRDISYRRQIDIERAEAARNKDAFIATLAHELRNPLAPLYNGWQIYKKAPPEDREEIYEMLGRQIRQVIHLVDDLLDVSRIAEGKVRLQKKPMLLQNAVDQAIEICLSAIEGKEHSLNLSVQPEPIHVYGDSARICQVVTNLLTNAAKYTPAQGRIELRVFERDERAWIQVTDSGIGIVPSMISEIFEPFAQIKNERDHSIGGLGLGLSIVKNLVELHEGSVSVESPGPGMGSTFTVILPLGQENNQLGNKRIIDDSIAQVPLRVLVVDDNPDVLQMTKMVLQVSGHEVVTAETGAAAIAAIKGNCFDVGFIDISLPDMTGRQVASAIRETEGSDIRLVAFSGYGTDLDRHLSLSTGFDDHVTKPAAVHIILKVLSEVKKRQPS